MNNKARSSIAVIGGGPGGLMAAEKLAQAGCKVTVYDHMPSLGRKFLMAGRGGLNLTHSEPLEIFVERYGVAADWLRPVIAAFPPQAVRDWCHELGQPVFTGSSGRVFPQAMKASPLLRAWLNRLESLGVQFALRHRWQGWNTNNDLIFATPQNQTLEIQTDATVLSLGGATWPRLGSDGRWTDILQAAGLGIAPWQPSNGGFLVPWSEVFARQFAGQPLKSAVFHCAGRVVRAEAMITRQGLEGGAIYALSALLRDAIARTGQAALTIDLRPEMTAKKVTERLERTSRGAQSDATYLRKALKLSPPEIGLMRESGGALPKQFGALAALVKSVPLRLTATAPLERAISSAGGLRRAELTDDFMLIKKPGTFAVGEMLDWEAPTGGYLLQACLSMGVAVAYAVKRYLENQR